MANHISHASLPYPIKNARFTVLVPYLDADGDPTDPTTPDTEVSQDGGAFADAAEEVTTITGSNGSGYITLSGAEMNNSAVAVAFKVASGPKATLANLYPRNLPILESGTAGAGASGSITLASGTYTGLDLTNCFVRTTGGTGGGGTGGANNQARRITAYNTSTRVATVTPNWETTPDNTTTYDILLPEGVMVPMITALRPTTLARTLDVSSGGEAGLDWANIGSPTTTVNLSGTTVKTATDVETDTADIQTRIPAALGANGNIKADVRDFNGTAGTFSGGIPDVNTVKLGGTTQTARDIGQSVLLSSGTGTGQLDFTSGRVKADTVYFGGDIGTFANGVPSVAPNLIRYNTAQGGTASSITLDAAASFEDHHVICWIVKGTGGRQVRLGKSWNNTTKVLEVTPDWTTAPDNTSCFAIEAIGPANVTEWIGVPVATPTVAGVPEVDVTYILGFGIDTNANPGQFPADIQAIGGDTAGVSGLTSMGDSYTSNGYINSNVSHISTDATAANNLEAALDGTGGVTITAAITGNITGNLSGSVGSVTGNVGGNVTGSVGSIATGGITSASFAAGAINNAAMSIDGSELTAIPWNASWDAEVQSEVQDAIEANNLDHLVKNAVDTDFATTVHLNSVIGYLADNGTSASFDRTTDSLEALYNSIDAVPTTTEIATAVWGEAQEGGYTARQIHELNGAVLWGILSGMDTGAATFKGLDGTTTRVAATVDSYGNRSGFTITPRAV